MAIRIVLDGSVEVEAPGITGQLARIANQAKRIADALETPPPPPPRPQLKVVGIMEIPRRKENRMIATGNHFFDKVLVHITLSPDGALDGPPAWASDNPGVTLTVSADGLTCDCGADGDIASDATVTVTAGVDVPATPDLETISEAFTMTFSHSKATALNASVGEIPR